MDCPGWTSFDGLFDQEMHVNDTNQTTNKSQISGTYPNPFYFSINPDTLNTQPIKPPPKQAFPRSPVPIQPP